MEMCYDGALVMPSNYAVMSEDEMMYVEGGKNGWWNSRSFIGTVLDVAIIAVTGVQTVTGIKAIRKIIKKNRKKMVKRIEKELYKHIGRASTAAITCAIDIALTLTGTSIGGLIASGLDYVDGKYNGYVFG